MDPSIAEKLVIRPMRPDDMDEVVGIQGSIIRKDVSPGWRGFLQEQIRSGSHLCLVAELGSRVEGFIIGEVKTGHFGLEKSGWIEMVGIRPKYMGQGIGKALAERLFTFWSGMGIYDIYTAVRWDAGDMLAFFKNLGFDRSNFINLKKRLGSSN